MEPTTTETPPDVTQRNIRLVHIVNTILFIVMGGFFLISAFFLTSISVLNGASPREGYALLAKSSIPPILYPAGFLLWVITWYTGVKIIRLSTSKQIGMFIGLLGSIVSILIIYTAFT